MQGGVGGWKLKEMQGDGIWESCLATTVCFPGVWADWGTLAHFQSASLKLKLLASEDGSVGTATPSKPPLDSYCQPLSSAQSSDNSIYLRQMSCFCRDYYHKQKNMQQYIQSNIQTHSPFLLWLLICTGVL